MWNLWIRTNLVLSWIWIIMQKMSNVGWDQTIQSFATSRKLYNTFMKHTEAKLMSQHWWNVPFCLGCWFIFLGQGGKCCCQEHRTPGQCEQHRSLQCFPSVSLSRWVLCDKPLEAQNNTQSQGTHCQRCWTIVSSLRQSHLNSETQTDEQTASVPTSVQTTHLCRNL